MRFIRDVQSMLNSASLRYRHCWYATGLRRGRGRACIGYRQWLTAGKALQCDIAASYY